MVRHLFWEQDYGGSNPSDSIVAIIKFMKTLMAMHQMKTFFIRWSWVLLCAFLATVEIIAGATYYALDNHGVMLAISIVSASVWIHNTIREFQITVRNRMEDRHDMELR